MTSRDPNAKRQTTRGILEALAQGDPDESVELATVLDDFGERGYGILLLIATLFAAIPIPGLAGGLSGPIVILVGLQMMIGLEHPWLPKFFRQRMIARSTFVRALSSLSSPFQYVERWIKPRLSAIFDHRAGEFVTGFLLALLGVLLFLPIPGTNYIFALLILLYAIAFIEKDGGIMLVCWGIGFVVIMIFGIMSGTLVAELNGLLEKLGRL